MHSTLAMVLDEKGHEVRTIGADATVRDAVREMNHHKIGCLMVMRGEKVAGIFTERDILTRVVDPVLDPASTLVEQVMTRKPVAVSPETTVEEAMAVVTDRRCRHLPVMDGDRLIGIVSIGDLTRWVTRAQHYHIQDLVKYITGAYPG